MENTHVLMTGEYQGYRIESGRVGTRGEYRARVYLSGSLVLCSPSIGGAGAKQRAFDSGKRLVDQGIAERKAAATV